MRQIPTNLVGYKIFDELAKLVREYEKYRIHWTIKLWQGKFICCQLTFTFGESQNGGLDQVNDTAEEAVFLAIEKFKSIEKQWSNTGNR